MLECLHDGQVPHEGSYRTWKADLHIHTCLSPCAEAEMTPEAIVATAASRGLDVIAICDHNSAENVRAVAAAAEGRTLTVMGGMEITSREEVHVLGLFDGSDAAALDALERIVYENLPGENDEATFGEQTVYGEDGSVVGRNTHLLIGATTLSLERVVEAIRDLGGVAIASHIDREGSTRSSSRRAPASASSGVPCRGRRGCRSSGPPTLTGSTRSARRRPSSR